MNKIAFKMPKGRLLLIMRSPYFMLMILCIVFLLSLQIGPVKVTRQRTLPHPAVYTRSTMFVNNNNQLIMYGSLVKKLESL